MTTKPNDLLTMLRDMTDDQFSSALAMDPDLIKKAQKALLDAKQKKIEIDRQKSLDLAAASGRPFDLKSWSRLKKLITGPYNEANALDFQATIVKTDPNITPEGEISLMKLSMDYLSERDRVQLEWPLVVFNSGAQFGYDEISSIITLFTRRGGIQDLGEPSRTLFAQVFCLAQPWAEHESKLIGAKILSVGLAELYQNIAFGGHSSGKASKEARNWEAIETLARAGCQALSTKIDGNAYRAAMLWEGLIAQPVDTSDAVEAKTSAFNTIINLGWCDTGVTNLSDNLVVQDAKSSNLPNCGSRSSLAHLPLDASGIEIFNMLCERESQQGFERYDPVGRSRLYFANERMRQLRGGDHGKERKVLLAIAQRCMELGDPPESVNSQNPLAKAADPHFAQVLASAIERRELGSIVSGASAPRVKTRSL